jgi:tetratricopeptide (TPR) repeat protein
MLLGTAHLELGNANLASGQFYQLRKAGGDLSEVATWWEAVADLQRGRPHATIKECADYRDQFPDGIYAQKCRVLIGDAQAARGNYGAATQAYNAYLADPVNAGQKRQEEMRVRVALAVARAKPERGIGLLQRLAAHHVYASTGMGAIRALDDLREAGHEAAVIPTDPQSRMALANSLRQSGWAAPAWTAFEALEEEAAEDRAIALWVDANRNRFIRSARRWDRPAVDQVSLYRVAEEAGNATPEMAWRIFDLWSKAGQWNKAVKWGRHGLDTHKDSRAWRSRLDEVARAEMLAGNWAESHKRWSEARAAGHGGRSNALFYGGLTGVLAGEHEAAEANLTDAIRASKYWRVAAHYWRSKARAGLADDKGAEEDRETVISLDGTGWYALWLQPAELEGDGWVRRDGSWQGEVMPELQTFTSPVFSAGTSVGQLPSSTPVVERGHTTGAGRLSPATATGWSTLGWPLAAAENEEVLVASVPPIVTVGRPIPDGYVEGDFYDPDAGLRNLSAIARNQAEVWPHLKSAVPLIRAGLYNQASPLVHKAYAEFRDPSTVPDAERRAAIVKLKGIVKGWKGAVQAARDHHHVVLNFWGVHHRMAPGEDREQVLRLQYPIAHGPELYAHCERWDVDPLLVLAVMRQESVYNANAMSPTGAMGLVQFITGTGAKVSAMLEEPLYSPDDMFNPSINLRYAVFYLKILSERFGGNFPMAVASYNGGPHFMSHDLRGMMDKVPLDAFVEMIERREPRDYVKKVTGYYQRYVELYAPDGARVVLPDMVTQDDPGIVDF